MKYESPELTALTSAINAIQSTLEKGQPGYLDTYIPNDPEPELVHAYTDWE